MNNSLSIFARALATENLSFAFDKEAKTASFDVKTRHLIMPMWNVSETVQTMLVAHEISHALWTPYEQSKTLMEQAEADGYILPLLQRICNVIEDVRIEKKMKDKFPGTRRDFFLGYKEINDLDLFGIKKADLTKQNIVSRLNIHYKWGVPGFIGVPFADHELGLVDEVDACETFEDAFVLAKKIYNLPEMEETVQKVKDELDKMKTEVSDDKGEEMESMIDTDIPGPGKKGGSTSFSPTVVIPEIKDLSKAIISTDQMIALFDNANASYPSVDIDGYRKFVRESDGYVRQLVAQFERRKAADEIRKERPKQTGQLNLDRLHQYRTHDDIFLSKIVKQDGKNHGIVFLIDFSGSMGHTIRNCVLQVMQLVSFCEKAKIPFEVFGFTDICVTLLPEDRKDFEAWCKKNPNKYQSDYRHANGIEIVGSQVNALSHGQARLLSIASSRDNAEKREKLLAHFYHTFVMGTRPRPFGMNGTPTVEAVAYASQFIRDWVTANNIQIPTLMVVTDGSPNGIYRGEVAGCKDEDQNIYNIGQNGSLTVVDKITDTITVVRERDMQNVCVGNACVGMMLNALRTKFNARLVGMYVVDDKTLHEGTFRNFCVSSKERETLGWSAINESPRYKAAKEQFNEGCIILHPDTFPGYDSYFLVRTPKPVEDAEAIAESGTFTKVKNQFIKTMAKRSGSRVFLTRYVDIVAGQAIRKGPDALYNTPVR